MICEIPQVKFSIAKTNKDNTDTTFVLSGLKTGIGIGLGNFLRITGYSYVYGCAPVAFKLVGVDFDMDSSSKFTTPVSDITLNIGKIKVRPDGLHQSFQLVYSGIIEGTLKAGDFTVVTNKGEVNTDIEILNPDLEILVTSSKDRVEMSVLFMVDMGYLGSEDMVTNIPPEISNYFNNAIRIDADFSPIERITYKVHENTPVAGQEALELSIRTDGTFKTIEALVFMGQFIFTHLEPLKNLYQVNWTNKPININETNAMYEMINKDMGVQTGTKVDNNLLWDSQSQNERVDKLTGISEEENLAVENLDISPKAYNWLKGNNLQNVRQLREYDENEGKNVFPEDIRGELMVALAEIGFKEVLKD